ncbi:dihydroneopterin aldolase [Synergistales bacterium]|nr:dihydroneopterin aldolase [Synergistales bacterium]GHV49790.1 dihydroneopterin aldolase [Synergistales bacterium]
MKAKCVVNGMVFHAFHGTMEVERELGQVFIVDVSIDFDCVQTEIVQTAEPVIRGQDIYDTAKDLILGTKFKSHAALAASLAGAMFKRFGRADEVHVSVGCRNIFIAGDVREMSAVAECVRKDFEAKG